MAEFFNLHSWELATAVDGPGTRLVLFFQGCPLRCVFCHNLDTQKFSSKPFKFEDVEAKIKRYIPIFEATNGGITLSGGEVFAQPSALKKILEIAKSLGVQTCLDTSGAKTSQLNSNELLEILNLTDLILLDVKGFDSKSQKELTGTDYFESWLSFAKLAVLKTKVRFRFVVIPKITAELEYLKNVKRMLNSNFNSFEIDLLPFHQLGSFKYQELGIEYKLADLPAATETELKTAREILIEN